MSEFAKQCLDAHNVYRARHRAPPLVLDGNLNAIAQEWANYIAARACMQHRQPNQYGENIFQSWSSDGAQQVHGKDAVDAWYSEIKDYIDGVSPNYMVTGHFTQVVWKDSQRLGVGYARNNQNQVYVVCNYDPPGNYQGRYGQNVLPCKI